MRVSQYLLLFPLLLTTDTRSGAEDLLLRDRQAPQERLLVLNSGRVVSGRLTARTGGYDVALPAGRMFVSSEQIRFTADGMDQAYQMMRDSFTERTPDVHLELARWCLSNRLPANARREILDALHLDPYRDDARLMLEKLVREQKRTAVSVTPQVDLAALTMPELLPERRSLGGLPKEAARTFTQRIQPMVSSKCGNARCHGTGQNRFTVVPIRDRSTTHIAEQNLAAILNQIDFQQPLQSPLLEATTGLHGGSRQLLFSGRSGGLQAETLREWVLDVAQELGPSETAARSVFQTSATEVPERHSNSDSPDVSSVYDALPQARRVAGAADDEFLNRAAEATRHDDFDPATFNRRYHGKTEDEIRSERAIR
ncbi:MAG: hypothetical protein RIK87_03705 [Fuerstiella sp.]